MGTQSEVSHLFHRAASCYEASSLTHRYFTPDKRFIWLSPPHSSINHPAHSQPSSSFDATLGDSTNAGRWIQQHLHAGSSSGRELKNVRCRTLLGLAEPWGGSGWPTPRGWGPLSRQPTLIGGMRGPAAVPMLSYRAGKHRGSESRRKAAPLHAPTTSPWGREGASGPPERDSAPQPAEKPRRPPHLFPLKVVL